MPRWLDAGRLRSADLDRRGALALHRAGARPLVLALCTWCSRLGDGPLWLGLVLLLPWVDSVAGRRCAVLVLALGVANLLIVWGLKRSMRRQRPFECCQGIRACVRAPDRFSFPSGHAMHAAAFALLLSAFYPLLGPLLWAFAAMVCVARVVLGVHYPSDVLAGALIGAGTASAALLGVALT